MSELNANIYNSQKEDLNIENERLTRKNIKQIMSENKHIIKSLNDKIKSGNEVAEDIRYLLERDYRRDSAIRFVADHYRLDKNERYILGRTVFSKKIASSRKGKKLNFSDLKSRKVLIDGYNVLITLESLIDGEEVWLADDSFLRDTRGVFKNHTNGNNTFKAVEEMLDFIRNSNTESAEVLLDTQMKNSGELAAFIRKRMDELLITGDAKTSKHVDYDLKNCDSDYVVATADGVIIDAVENVVDIPGCIFSSSNR
ncbi:DUF434 domain-containing protein [Methanolobus bombayensis]|uniref:DUF434 domain-containing protein n=1 Tax=Methanolobus bombayensis TaxID=38023 RepID=UPI001FD73AD3|nr:DUF434 domain-containing protein [Methanolobus bombayensis]MBP1908874.1 hypothetical protein [Methanolobus bombayensis]